MPKHTDGCAATSYDKFCLCGCGKRYKGQNSRFVPGHDVRAIDRIWKSKGYCCRADFVAQLAGHPQDKPLPPLR